MKSSLLPILILMLLGCDPATGKKAKEQEVPPPETRTTTPENGMQEIRDEAGNVIMRGEMINGKREGGWESYFPDGTLRSRGTFVNGFQEGPTTVYHPNGAVMYTGWFKKGRPVSDWLFFDEEGKQVKIARYSQDGDLLEQKEF